MSTRDPFRISTGNCVYQPDFYEDDEPVEKVQAAFEAGEKTVTVARTPCETLPPHLRDDAPYQQCTKCGRKTWDRNLWEGVCGMPQRASAATGKWIDPCGGTFRSAMGRAS